MSLLAMQRGTGLIRGLRWLVGLIWLAGGIGAAVAGLVMFALGRGGNGGFYLFGGAIQAAVAWWFVLPRRPSLRGWRLRG